MGMYISRYDWSPMPEPGNESADDADPKPVAQSKRLLVNWATPQPLHTYTAPPPKSGQSGDGDQHDGNTHNDGGTHDDGGDRNPLLKHIPTPGEVHGMILGLHGPYFESVHVRPEDLLAHEQNVLDLAKVLVDHFNTLVATSETAMTADWWGLEEGANQTQHHMPGQKDQDNGDFGDIYGPHYVYTNSALMTQKFVKSLQVNQRSALQHAADMVTLSGVFIELLNATADGYAQGDQACVFPDKSSIVGGDSH
jgi:hypothetical protein